MMDQIDENQHNGSGLVLDQFVELDVNIATYAPFLRDINENNYYDEVEREGWELRVIN